MAASLSSQALAGDESAAAHPACKRGPKPQSLIMKVTYVAKEGWDYKRAIYPALREWGFFDTISSQDSHHD